MENQESTFTDLFGEKWNIYIRTRDVERVRDHVQGADGKPVDLLAIAEQGDFSAISGNVQRVVDVVFWLCFDTVMERFNVEQYDREHATEYEMDPRSAGKSTLAKAACWFGNRIGGNELEQIIAAWEVAIVNFIPNPRLRECVRTVAAKAQEKNLALVDFCEARLIKQLDKEVAERKKQLEEGELGQLFGNSPEKSASTRKRSRSGS